jgi:hypothetical protein
MTHLQLTDPNGMMEVDSGNEFLEARMVDLEKALVNPGLVFKTPEEVLQRNDLSREQKIEILRRWEYDVRQLQVAEEESMAGPQPVTLDAVLNALRALGASSDPERSAPTKQGGS